MTDLLSVLPGFPVATYSHLIPSLDKHCVTTADLLTMEAPEIAKRAQLPPVEIAKLIDAVLSALRTYTTPRHYSISTVAASDATIEDQTGRRSQASQDDLEEVMPANGSTRPVDPAISTLDPQLDEALGGGIRPGYLTEITGESGVGKTQFLLTSLLSVQLPPPRGLGKSAVYISTEAPLATSRLYQLIRSHPDICNLPAKEKPSLDRILSIQCPDLETQDHILRFQLPIAIKRRDIGLVIVDSIAANFRAEFEKSEPASIGVRERDEKRAGRAMAERRSQLIQLGAFLRALARDENIAVLVANQVADRFSPAYASQPSSSAMSSYISPDPLSLDHQQRWFTGWGDSQEWSFLQSLKTPSLGLVWTNQLAARIALIKQTQTGGETKPRRWMRVVFAPWCASSARRGVEYEILGEGLKAVPLKNSMKDPA